MWIIERIACKYHTCYWIMPDDGLFGGGIVEYEVREDEYTVGKLIERHRYTDPDLDIQVRIGDTALIATGEARRNSDKRSEGCINAIDYDTVASDHMIESPEEWRDDNIVQKDTLIISVSDSTEENNPNIKRYMDAGLTYAQAKIVHLRNLGFEQSKIAEMEGVTKTAIQQREKLGSSKLGKIMLYKAF